MSDSDKKPGIIGRLKLFFSRLWNGRHTIGDLVKHKHRFVVLDTDTYKEEISFQLSGINIFVFLGITALVLVFLTGLLLAFTPLRELIPGYSSQKMTEQTYANARRVDSLSLQLAQQEALLADIQDVMLGKDPSARHSQGQRSAADSTKATPTPYVRSVEDSLLRADIESRGGDKNYAKPLEGKITKKYNSRNDFKGIVIEGSRDDRVRSIQAGRVLLCEKNVDGVLTIVVQHNAQEISIYTAEGTAEKNAGETVRAGEPLMKLQPKQRKGQATLQFTMLREDQPVDPKELF